jgi:hypothetical protein
MRRVQGYHMNQSQSGRNTGAIILIAVGVLFFLSQTLNINIWGIFGLSWPLFIVLPGLLFLALAIFGDKKVAGFIMPGAIITGTGLLLWVQNATGHWESWAYAWSLYPVFVGLGLTFLGRRTDNANAEKTGRGMVTWGVVAFLVLFAFFEVLIFGGLAGLGNIVVPLLLIGVGAYLLLGGRGRSLDDKSKRKNEAPVFTGPRVLNSRRANGHVPSASDDLQRRIDEAIAEDDPDAPKTTL